MRIIALLVLSALLSVSSASAQSAKYKIVTASEKGTYIVIGRDLSQYVAAPVGIDLESVPSAGSVDNVRRLRYEPGVKLALVQSDVFQSYLDLAATGDKAARTLIQPLRLILPLYDEEIHFIVRADSPLNYVHEIEGARMSIGPIGSGTALTASTLYRVMFGYPIPDGKFSFATNEEGLLRLVTDKSVDVVAVVAGQPARLFTDMKPEASKLIKILKVDPNNRTTEVATKTYFLTSLKSSNYPSLLSEDARALSVKAYLVTYDYGTADTRATLAKFASSMCDNFAKLQESGHPKWKEVRLELIEPGVGWIYYPWTSNELRKCAKPRKPLKGLCSVEGTILGLCAKEN